MIEDNVLSDENPYVASKQPANDQQSADQSTGGSSTLDQQALEQRDAMTLKVLGIFFLVLGSLVLIGSLWSIGNTPALIVNVCAGLVLMGTGAGAKWIATRLASK